MKKVTVVFIGFLLFAPVFATASIITPSANINIVINTVGEDGEFNFHLTDGNVVSNQIYDFTITTENNIGSYNSEVVFPDSTGFYLTESVPSGWQLTSASCRGSDPGNYSTPFENGVHLFVTTFTTINCTFTNSKITQKTPVLIVPGIMGTEIYKEQEVLWPDVGRMLNPLHSDDFMDPLFFKTDASPLDTSLSLGKVIDQAGTLDYTKNLITDLKNEGYVSGKDLFLFAYDWRRDNTDTAVKDDLQLKNPSLKQIINQILLSSGSNKIDIIAHSQGGLIVKKLLANLPEYESKINKLVFVGTPHLGAPLAAKVLLYGDNMDVAFAGMGLDPEEVKKISQNMPSVYELLPSQEYFNHTNGYLGKAEVVSGSQNVLHVTTLNATDTTEFLKNQSLNSSLIDRSKDFHLPSYDNLDLSGSGIKSYNIVGCQAGTPGKIAVKADGSFNIVPIPGDGTVPVFSASNIFGAQTFYALEADHGTMLTQDGIRQMIVNLITGSTNSTKGNITPNISDCHFDGTQVSSHSPVILHIYDSTGRHVGPTADGGFDAEIPNVGYQTIGHESFAFLPEGSNYTVKLVATGDGSFSFDSSKIQNEQTIGTAYYSDVPITASSTAEIILNESNNQVIQLDVEGNGSADQSIEPSSILDSNQSKDLAPPVSSSTIMGFVGAPGFYRSEATITLSSLDPVINNDPSQTSGLLKTQYNLDDEGWKTCELTLIPPQQGEGCVLSVGSEGHHTFSFYSTDRAGNNEPEQTINFTVDKTAPESLIRFNPALKDVEFIGQDNLSTTSAVMVIDADNLITITDQAGNITKLKLKDWDRKHKFKAEIKSVTYNGVLQSIDKSSLGFQWFYNKQGSLEALAQKVKSKKDYNIGSVYAGNKTWILGKDQNGILNNTFNNLVLLQVTTNQGDFMWSY